MQQRGEGMGDKVLELQNAATEFILATDDPYANQPLKVRAHKRLGLALAAMAALQSSSPSPGGRDKTAAIMLQWQMEYDGDYPIEGAIACLAEYRAAKHSGDCTSESHTCLRCQCDAAYKQADQVLALRSTPLPADEPSDEALREDILAFMQEGLSDCKPESIFDVEWADMLGRIADNIARAVKAKIRRRG